MGQYSGKICYIEKAGLQDEGVATWLNVVVTTHPSSGMPRENQAKFNDRTVLGL